MSLRSWISNAKEDIDVKSLRLSINSWCTLILKKKISSSSANYKGLASNTAQTQTITMYSTQVMVSKYYVSVNGTKDSLENG